MKKIIEELTKNSKQSTKQLSRKLSIPITTIHNRIKKLEKEKIILNYSTNLNYSKLGRPITAYVGITINYNVQSKKIDQVTISKLIHRIDGIYETYIMAGGFDILVKIRAKDIPDINKIITEEIRNIDGIDKTQTMIVLNEV